ncbi:hypothetical protein Taro_009445 [Colocasia esculenta]|uniref:Uncharacterized protein n=1 Tax=Colocasia esculenta TaxID=4460 RepID=A0A843U0V1_COLES|nr:hypothetical protein [Colocasia esculenta]
MGSPAARGRRWEAPSPLELAAAAATAQHCRPLLHPPLLHLRRCSLERETQPEQGQRRDALGRLPWPPTRPASSAAPSSPSLSPPSSLLGNPEPGGCQPPLLRLRHSPAPPARHHRSSPLRLFIFLSIAPTAVASALSSSPGRPFSFVALLRHLRSHGHPRPASRHILSRITLSLSLAAAAEPRRRRARAVAAMADYHFVYKDVEGTSTQWDDIQRRLGNLLPKPEPFKPPPFTPCPVDDARPAKTASWIDEQTEEELEDDRGLDDDLFLEEYRKKRLVELRELARISRFGSVVPISGSDFVREVSQAPPDVWVVVLLY